MMKLEEIYCLDTNVLIQAWQKYYSEKLCPDYWMVLNELGKRGKIFIPEEVFQEIMKVDDGLLAWLKESKITVRKKDSIVTENLSKIFSSDPKHKLLVDATKRRSLADPWVIAHSMKEKATLVTKEEKDKSPLSKKIKIPDVCENMKVRCINDFQFIDEVGIRFSCKIL
jgi:predicted nucleic-acid-binding protein